MYFLAEVYFFLAEVVFLAEVYFSFAEVYLGFQTTNHSISEWGGVWNNFTMLIYNDNFASNIYVFFFLKSLSDIPLDLLDEKY